MPLRKQLAIAALSIIVGVVGAGSSGSSSSSYGSTNTDPDSGSFLKLRQKLAPGPGDVLETLDQYDKLWIGKSPLLQK